MTTRINYQRKTYILFGISTYHKTGFGTCFFGFRRTETISTKLARRSQGETTTLSLRSAENKKQYVWLSLIRFWQSSDINLFTIKIIFKIEYFFMASMLFWCYQNQYQYPVFIISHAEPNRIPKWSQVKWRKISNSYNVR